MIHILFFSLKVVAKKITPANDKNVLVLYVKLLCIFELKTKDFIVIDEIETTELIPAQ